MSSFSPSFRVLAPLWRQSNVRFLLFMHSNRNNGIFIPRVLASSTSTSTNTNDDSGSTPKQTQLGYDPSELFGLEANLKSRNGDFDSDKQRSWFGPNGQYIRELPCPTCRGRGYTPCIECGIERSRPNCSKCKGKGIMTCHQCLGECVTWEESIDERPWEKARSISPLKVEDDEVDNLDIKLVMTRKSKRVYQSPPPEVGLKISRSLKSLNAKTGLFSKRMKIIHRDPRLHAQRVAAIKKAKGTADARKHASEALKAFFSDPENRRKRSIAMKGVKFFCKNCGREGHRRHYCPELKGLIGRQFKCRMCGKKGHNRRTCPKTRLHSHKRRVRKHFCCSICHGRGHNRRTCPKVIGAESSNSGVTKCSLIFESRKYKCRLCQQEGHNIRTCPGRNVNDSEFQEGTR
ncbi:uncharacterized protein LOC133823096 [Humulus lupulus]|uniref:uncharacterized protein LOC133823096 n=1 Tax=Humulus lupulus TaxID=3486 RepID=UPI002B407421|nr:uncharacterized protein LOC133823096 [Humulus lupulus]